MMELEFFGASEGVTGSCHILRVNNQQILLDCGLFQGGRREEAGNRAPFPFDPAQIDAVVLSHAHIDHSGRIPLLVKQGFKGPVYAQNATKELCRVLLLDSASLQERDAIYQNKRRARKNQSALEPLYTTDDALDALQQFQGLKYKQKQEILPGIVIRYQDAGHILGSAAVELWLTENGQTKKLVFSGDIGHYDTPILNDPAVITEADLVLMESTYGNRLHRNRELTENEIGEVIQTARHQKGNILIPAFAIGRSQEILYMMGTHYDEWELDRWNIFLDSPMAIEASKIYWEYSHLYDEEASKLRNQLDTMPKLRNIHFTRSVEESQAINRIKSGAIIIAGSGMSTGGRILHHYKENIWRKECHIIIVGYQAYGTLGRRLVNGDEQVRIHGDYYRLRAQVHTVGGLSAHADQAGLLRWIGGFTSNPQVFVVHGDSDVRESFSALLEDQLQLRSRVAHSGDKVDLLAL